MINVRIEESELLDMLMERIKFWNPDNTTYDLYYSMYENYCYGGFFDNVELDIMKIVDDDYVNWCGVISKNDNEFKELLEIYNKQGLGDCSCECNFADFIEAVDNESEPEAFLVRNC